MSGAADRKRAEAAQAKQLAAKQFANAIATVDNLTDQAFHKWQGQLLRTAHSCEWHGTVLGGDGEAPDTPKHDADVRNAYDLIMAKTNGHPVDSKLEEVEIGDAAGAWQTVFEYFIQTTSRGRKTATDNFWFLHYGKH